MYSRHYSPWRWIVPVGVVVILSSLIFGIILSLKTITPQPDEIILHYKGGPYDGNQFDRIILPGTREGNRTVADNNYSLPTSLRYWKIARGDSSVVDRKEPIVAPARVEDDEGGVLVNVWLQVTFYLNTNHDDIDGYDGGTLRKFWERLGRRFYENNSDTWWDDMLRATVDTSLENVINEVVPPYDADDLNYNRNGARAKAQADIGSQFNQELRRLAGGEFFCGPSFVPTWDAESNGTATCPPVEITITDVDFANPEIQAARDNRQKAVEQAAAELEEAQGKLAAQEAINKALKDPNYLHYLIEQMKLDQAKSCASASSCVLILGGDNPSVNVNTARP